MTALNDLILGTAHRGELHHATILHGPSETELVSLAFDIARTLNCPNDSIGGDGCDTCRRIERLIHPDVHLVGITENRTLISVAQIRAIVIEAGLKSYEGRNKVFIIRTADAMSSGGANALLKTLEEPVADTYFILLTRSADRLLPTIRSRSQAISVHSSTRAQTNVSASAEELKIRAAAPTIEDEDRDVKVATEMIAWLDRYASSGEIASLLALSKLASGGPDPAQGLFLLAMIFRDLSSLDPDTSIDPTAFERIQQRLDPRRLLDAATCAIRGASRLAVHAEPGLMADQAVLRLHPGSTAAVSRRLP